MGNAGRHVATSHKTVRAYLKSKLRDMIIDLEDISSGEVESTLTDMQKAGIKKDLIKMALDAEKYLESDHVLKAKGNKKDSKGASGEVVLLKPLIKMTAD